jgi:hypothetical protein
MSTGKPRQKLFLAGSVQQDLDAIIRNVKVKAGWTVNKKKA